MISERSGVSAAEFATKSTLPAPRGCVGVDTADVANEREGELAATEESDELKRGSGNGAAFPPATLSGLREVG